MILYFFQDGRGFVMRVLRPPRRVLGGLYRCV